MRRITFALLLLSAAGWAGPSRAQWWGWDRPCIGAFGPGTCSGGGWAPPARVVEIVPDWRFRAWRREMRLRRIENWHRWVEASRPAEPVAEPPPPWFRRRVRPSPFPVATRDGAPRPEAGPRGRSPVSRPPAEERPAAAAVALMPATARFARPRLGAAVPSPLLAAAARRPALPPSRPAPVVPAALRGPEAPARPAFRTLRPAVLRSEPAPAVAAPAVEAAPAAPAAAKPAPAAPADVPVAPLD